MTITFAAPEALVATVAAERAQAALVISTEPLLASPAAPTAISGVGGLAALAAMGLNQVEVEVDG
jgi:hypothetical protein